MGMLVDGKFKAVFSFFYGQYILTEYWMLRMKSGWWLDNLHGVFLMCFVGLLCNT